ncbi:mucin-2 [Musca vetustissima]|uniref:mucin-2 n=1 Tax=Musca vetustissima TaxID=27455 RepID=UPI002AB7A5B3|nr:mucin-2 [Musca vetustissima]
MDSRPNLENLCRVCAANTKGKNSECVYILKTPGLRDKLDKFLYLKMFENDALPKILCKSCFRQVEATASLSKIAKHTQQVFRDFLFSSLPKNTKPLETANNSNSEFTSSDFLSQKTDGEKTSNESSSSSASNAKSQPPTLTQMQSPPPPPPPQSAAQLSTTPRKDDVVVNVSVADPLTRENQQKMISNSQRRHSIMVDISSVGSLSNIATNLAQLSQQNTNNTASSTGHSSGRKSASPARVMKYCQISAKSLHQHQPNQVTTFSSGGYVIEPLKLPTETTATTEKEVNKKSTPPLTITATGATPAAITVTDNTILQQKRKNLVKALNNIKANSSGQVSLLKSSQTKPTTGAPTSTQNQQQSLLLTNQLPSKTSLLVENIVKQVGDELPDRIIIAAPKNKAANKMKKPEEASANNPTAVIPPSTLVISEIPASKQPVQPTVVQQQQPQQPPPAPQPTKSSNFPEDILLGRVIKDLDLLKLILKALKWPVNKQNMELQLQRLKNTRFTDIMSDPNLLQDTDLTQLLGPYLAPVLLAAQALQQQQQQIMMNNGSAAAKKTNPSLLNTTPNKVAIPYKLPPETSVQLVPALPEETMQKEIPTTLKRSHSKESNKSSAPLVKRQRKSAAGGIQKHRDSIVISDEEEEAPGANDNTTKSNVRQRSNKPMTNYEIDLTNPSFLVQLGLLNGSSSEQANEALMALLAKQAKVKQQQNVAPKKRHSSISHNPVVANNGNNPNSSGNANEFDGLINIDDDLVLMEPVTTTSTPNTTSKEPGNTTLPTIDISNFVMPQQLQNSTPIITRPIIKRRKTVIQSAKVGAVPATPTTTSSGTTPEDSNKLEKDSKKPTQEELPSTTSNTTPSTPSSAETSPTKSGGGSSRKQQNKAALGQQLLEAIGLQKIQTKETGNTTVHFAATSANDTPPSPAMGVKQSVQQIRSALKKSLKKAQEQQQMRNKDSASTTTTTIIQDADSTTKSTIKDIVIEHRSNKSVDSSTTHDDIEEQIETITLVKSQNGPTPQENTPKDELKKENATRKKAGNTAGRITERRSTLPSSAGRVRFNLNTKQDKGEEKSTDNGKKETENKSSQEEKIKSEADSPNVSSTSSTTTTDQQAKEETSETPRRRGGRKRITEAAETTESSNANEKENNDKEKEKDKTKESDKDSDKKKDKENEKSKDKDNEKEKSSDKNKDKIKEELDDSSSNSGRPTRQSKTLSKYYKGPDKSAVSRRSLPARSTRNR